MRECFMQSTLCPIEVPEELHSRKVGCKDELLSFPQESSVLLTWIKSNGKKKDLLEAGKVHATIIKGGFLQQDRCVGTALLHMYATCGALGKAQQVFEDLVVHDIASWNALISGYARHGSGDEAFKCFGCMQDEGLSPNTITYLCLLKACGSVGAADKGEKIHSIASRQGLLKENIVLATALVEMYVKCRMLSKAREVFDELSVRRDVVSYNVLIMGYSQHGLGEEALKCFGRMKEEGLSPDVTTFACILKACGTLEEIEEGEGIHAEVCKHGLLEKDMVLGTALLDMYAKCGRIAKAQLIFDELPWHDVATWTALLAGYANHGFPNEALRCYGQMQEEGLSPNAITFVCILKACGSIGAIEKGKEVAAKIRRVGLVEDNLILGTALVDMYAKCGALASAQEAFDKFPRWDVASWTALVGGYADQGLGDEALNCYRRMREEGFSPDIPTFVCVLKACGNIGASEEGEGIHAEVKQWLVKHVGLGYALVDMYAKCGMLAKAQQVFEGLPTRDVVSWTAIISGYVQLGMAKGAFDSVGKMIREGIEPNAVTFSVMLNVCSHGGLVQESHLNLGIMSSIYHILPTIEHQMCMVDMFSRAGHFDEAMGLIANVPASDHLLLWLALLGACPHVELGRWVFKHAVELDKTCNAAYVCMNNLYATFDGLQEELDICGSRDYVQNTNAHHNSYTMNYDNWPQ